MKSRTSYFDIIHIKGVLRDYWWISLLYMALLTLVVTFKVIDLNALSYTMEIHFKSLFHLKMYPLPIFIIVGYPVFMAVLLFRHVHSKRASDWMHSLPLRREAIFASRTIAGICMLLIPILITAAICIILRTTMHMEKYYGYADVAYWMQFTFLFDLVMFSTSLFFCMLTGMTVLQLVFTYGFLFMPGVLFVATDYLLAAILNGYSASMDRSWLLDSFSPVGSLMNYSQDNGQGASAAVLLVISLAFLIGALLLYVRRNSEAATEAIAFRHLKSVFKYLVTFSGMLGFGAYFQSVWSSMSMLMIGCLFGAVVGYFGSEMLICKSPLVFGKYKGFLVYLMAAALVYAGIRLDLTGFVNRVPEVAEVAYANHMDYSFFSEKQREINSFRTKDNLERIIKLHKQAIKSSDRNRKGSVNIRLHYMLKDGKTLDRAYYLDQNTFEDFLKGIYNTEEYKATAYPFYRLKPDDVASVSLFPYHNAAQSTTELGKDKIGAFLEKLRSGYRNMTYAQTKKSWSPFVSVQFMIKPQSKEKYFLGEQQSIIIADLPSTFVELRKWLVAEAHFKP